MQEKKFINKNIQYKDYVYFNYYGKIYPIIYLIFFPKSEFFIKLIKKCKININCTDMKNQTLLMYLLQVQNHIKKLI